MLTEHHVYHSIIAHHAHYCTCLYVHNLLFQADSSSEGGCSCYSPLWVQSHTQGQVHRWLVNVCGMDVSDRGRGAQCIALCNSIDVHCLLQLLSAKRSQVRAVLVAHTHGHVPCLRDSS